MSHVDTRQTARDSLFLLAMLKVDGDPRDTAHRVKVRNLSATGVMAEGDVKIAPGMHITIELRNIGWVEGSVAWKQDNRFGIAFAQEVDHLRVRDNGKASDAEHETARFIRPASRRSSTTQARLRKV